MRRLLPASSLYVAHTCVCLAFGVSAVSIAAQPTSRPIRQSTTAITRGQSISQPSTGVSVRYPTMLDMTFPEFEAAVKRTDIVLLPVGSIEEHSVHLPLSTDAINSTALMFHVQQYLRKVGIETILGPPLNIGITYDAGDGTRIADPKYPGISPSGRRRSRRCMSTCCGRGGDPIWWTGWLSRRVLSLSFSQQIL